MRDEKQKTGKRMGRPPKPGAKKIFVGLRVTEEELARLHRGAKAAGMSLGGFIMAPHRKEGGK